MPRSLDKDPLYQNLLFSLPMREGVGVPRDAAKAHHPISVAGAPAWAQLPSGLWVMDFNGTSDCLVSPNASTTDMNFTAGDFSITAWIKPTNILSEVRSIVGRGRSTFDGWRLWHLGDSIRAETNGPAATPSYGFGIAAMTWQLVGASRHGASVRVYINGRDVTYSAGDHSAGALTPPASRNFCIGAYTETSYWFLGLIGPTSIWGRALSSLEHRELFNREREKVGV